MFLAYRSNVQTRRLAQHGNHSQSGLCLHQENGMVVFGIFVSGKGSLMSLSFENMSLGYLFLGWMSLALEGHL